MTDEKLYQTIATELETGSRDSVLWTRAFAEADGNSDRAQALYIRLRLQALKKAAVAIAVTKHVETHSQFQGSEVDQIRHELSEAVSARTISSFYNVLGLTPTASDAEIARAIADGEARIESGASVASPEFRYAKEMLGDPQARDNYDRKLYDKVLNTPISPLPRIQTTPYVQPEGIFLPWWASKKVSAIIALIAILSIGYLILDFRQERGVQEVQKASIQVQNEVARAAAASESGRVANERLAIEGRISLTDKAIDRSSEIRNRALSIEEREAERRRTELEYRANAGSQLLELERERQRHQIAMQQERLRIQEREAEQRKDRRERAYWACMNAALDRTDSRTASAHCAGYR